MTMLPMGEAKSTYLPSSSRIVLVPDRRPWSGNEGVEALPAVSSHTCHE